MRPVPSDDAAYFVATSRPVSSITWAVRCDYALVVAGIRAIIGFRTSSRAGFVSNTALAQLVAAHVGERGAAQSAFEVESATLAARIELAVHMVADLDRRLRQIDAAVEETAKRITDMPLPRETRRKHREQASQFYVFGLDEIVPKGHLFRTRVGLRAGGTAFGALKASVLYLGRRVSRWR